MSLPVLTRTIDDAFTHTWFEIRPEAIDNILDANVVTAALRAAGCFTAQVGGDRITRTIRYGTKRATNVKKGDTLSHGEDAIETMAWWNWKYITAHVQRSLQDDQKNNGKSKIKSLVATKLEAARDALNTAFETNFLAAVDTSGSADEVKDLRLERDPNSFYNFLPGGSYYNSSSYRFGHIDFGNTWWRGKYKTATDPAEVNLLADMKNLYNTCGANKSYPNLIITDQTLFEIYEDFALDRTQIVKGGRLADLGYEELKFKGKSLVWSDNVTAGTMLFLNTEFIEVVYDPEVWFEMTAWKPIPLQTERIAHIICTMNLICSQLRRQGWLGTYS